MHSWGDGKWREQLWPAVMALSATPFTLLAASPSRSVLLYIYLQFAVHAFNELQWGNEAMRQWGNVAVALPFCGQVGKRNGRRDTWSGQNKKKKQSENNAADNGQGRAAQGIAHEEAQNVCSVKMRGKCVNDTEQFTIIARAMSESNGQWAMGNGQCIRGQPLKFSWHTQAESQSWKSY